MKTKHFQVHSFLYTDLKQGSPSKRWAAALLQQEEQMRAPKASPALGAAH